MSSLVCVALLVCGSSGSVALLVVALFYVALLACGSSGMWFFWYVALLVAWLSWSCGSSSIDSTHLAGILN